MLMAAGANFGFKRAIPHMTGIVIGVTVLTFLVGAGLMALFDAFPALGIVLKVAFAVIIIDGLTAVPTLSKLFGGE